MLTRILGSSFVALCLLVAGAQPSLAEGSIDSTGGIAPIVVADSHGTRDDGIEPRYQPREPEPEPMYNNEYLFALTRSVANSTIVPAGKVPLYVLTVPLDIAFLPFALIGGLFG